MVDQLSRLEALGPDPVWQPSSALAACSVSPVPGEDVSSERTRRLQEGGSPEGLVGHHCSETPGNSALLPASVSSLPRLPKDQPH